MAMDREARQHLIGAELDEEANIGIADGSPRPGGSPALVDSFLAFITRMG